MKTLKCLTVESSCGTQPRIFLMQAHMWWGSIIALRQDQI